MCFMPSELWILKGFLDFATKRDQLICASLVADESSTCIIDTRLPSRFNLSRGFTVIQSTLETECALAYNTCYAQALK
jgi:hypothetical protein